MEWVIAPPFTDPATPLTDTGSPAWNNQPAPAPWPEYTPAPWSDDAPAGGAAPATSGHHAVPAEWRNTGTVTPAAGTRRATLALLLAAAAVPLSLCAFGLPAGAAILLGALHLRHTTSGAPGRRRAITAICLSAVLLLPSIVLSIGFWSATSA